MRFKHIILLFVFSVVELIGIRTFFAPCGPKEDGSWMSCHWAGQAVTGTAAVLGFREGHFHLPVSASMKFRPSLQIRPSRVPVQRVMARKG